MYSLDIVRSAKKELKNIDKSSQLFITNSLIDFTSKFDNNYEVSLMKKGIIKKLKGQSQDLYRLKLRSYRIIYKKEDNVLVILVLSITTREGAYR